MSSAVLLALGLPLAVLLLSTLWLRRHPHRLPAVLQRLSSRNAIAWNALVGLSIALGVWRWLASQRPS